MPDSPTRSGPEHAEATAARSGPLAGVRVLDLTTVVMGPVATQLLGDLGADVIKVETPEGDTMRAIGPFRHAGMGPLYLQNNRNKRSVVLDLKTSAGRDTLLALAGRTDVLVSNIRPQALARLGLDYATLQATHPGLIYCTAVGYGTDGPLAGQAVYDDLMQAASGIAGLFRTVDGAPRYAPVNLCDRVVGLYLAIAILGALHHRQATGEGQAVEVPMFETMAQFVLGDHIGGAVFEPPEGPMGYKRLLSRVRGPYATKDGHLSLVVYTQRQWRAFLALVGQPQLLDQDPRFLNQETRTQYAEELGRFIASQMPARTNAEWTQLLREADIPVSPVNAIEDLFDDPHLQAVGLFQTVEHPTEGLIRTTRFPVRYSRTPATLRRPAPCLGEHTDEVLRELGATPPSHQEHP